MDKVSKLILCTIPTSVCNFRCRYCYLAQRDESYQGEIAKIKYSPEHVARALSKERLGGGCYFNFCANGETLLTKNLDKYIYLIAKQGHYVEIVTNMVITPVLNKIFAWEKEVLEHITFKCSFHYLQLKERNLLEVFANNVNKAWELGCSANIEITPDDELIPYIEEVKEFSMKNFGALPHLSIARDDTNNHEFLTKLTREEYEKVWSQFDSDFWKFKLTIFNVKRQEYCYAGAWSLYLNFATGDSMQCYYGGYSQNVYKNTDKPIKWCAAGKCPDTHCYNGHALLTLGLIPNLTDVKYGDIRDRVRQDGTHWIQPKMKEFLNSQLVDTNKEFTQKQINKNNKILKRQQNVNNIKRFVKKILRKG